MANRILITGGSGMIGRKLTTLLLTEGYEIAWLSRTGKAMDNVKGYYWDIEKQKADPDAFDNLFGIIHLAGEGIANKRWTLKQKRKILDSRTKSTVLLIQMLKETKSNVEVLLSASGIGYYGYDNGAAIVYEDSPSGSDFIADVVQQWEEGVKQFEVLGTRVVMLRTGMVMSTEGGALVKISTPVKWGLGAPLGKGDQLISWIHIDDLCRFYVFALKNKPIEGAYNATTVNPISNEELTKAIATTLKRSLFLPNIPNFALKLMFGEMSNLILGGGSVSPKKIMDSGFEFQYPELHEALNHLFKN